MTVNVSIITVTYNSEKQIGRLLDSLAKSKDGLTKEIIIVDNASQDNTVKLVSSHKSKPLLIKSTTNSGFSKAVNLGIKKSTGNFIFLLNPDTELVGNSLANLVNFARSTSPLGAVAPRLLNPNGKPQPSVSKFPTIINAIMHDFLGNKNSFGKYLPSSTQKVDVAVMAAFLIPRSTIDTVGLLDERFFLYYEDIEYCRRLKQNKLPVYYYPNSKVKHVHGASGNFVNHLKSPLLTSAQIYYGNTYSKLLNLTLWIGHKWQVILRRKRFRD